MPSSVWTVWKTPERFDRMLEAMRYFGTRGTTALMDALLTFFEKRRDYNALLRDAKRLCELIVNSPPETTIKGEIESAAFMFLMHTDILNLAPSPEPAAPTAENSVSTATHTGHTQEE